MKLFFSLIIMITSTLAYEKNEIIFLSPDSVNITAQKYFTNDMENPLIILFHQAGWSHGEYIEIAPKLNQLGFNCIAVNLRSGGEVNAIVNKTNLDALKKGITTSYLDAFVDMEATLDHVSKNFSPPTLIVWGSSYSAALSLKLAAENSELINGVLAFSPGEYFSKLGQSESFIKESVKNLNCPVFITSAKNEKSNWEMIYNNIPSKDKSFYLPETKGNHGSRALWKKFADSKEYWTAVKVFLTKFTKVEKVQSIKNLQIE